MLPNSFIVTANSAPVPLLLMVIVGGVTYPNPGVSCLPVGSVPENNTSTISPSLLTVA